jgi:hypothetical protein
MLAIKSTFPPSPMLTSWAAVVMPLYDMLLEILAWMNYFTGKSKMLPALMGLPDAYKIHALTV